MRPLSAPAAIGNPPLNETPSLGPKMTETGFIGPILSTVLMLVIAVAGVVGTIFTVNKWIKWGIVILIAVGALGTFLQSYQTSRDTEFLKGALSTMLASMPETPGFSDTISTSAYSVARDHGFYIPIHYSGQAGSLYLLSPMGEAKSSFEDLVKANIEAILIIGPELRGQLYVDYVSGQDMKPLLNQAAFGTEGFSGSTEEKARNAIFDDFRAVCEFALDGEMQRRGASNGGVTSAVRYDQKRVSCTSDDPKMSLSLDLDFVEKVRPMRRGERNARAYSEFMQQLAKLR